ncbi:MAG: single-stranded-DNA-specific exonuclease RecJ [bacterium]|nr:single-stranded-DNA-specific exonuclease RecJ [bacterium]
MFSLHEPLDETTRAELAEYDDFTAALLSRRGVTDREAAARFLNPSYDLHLHDPLLMTDMEKAAKRLAQAIAAGEKIAVWSDYDCDGGPGGVLMHDFLEKVGANFENYIPHRHLEGYGVNVGGIEKLAKSGVTLVVTVDSGITDCEPVARARELGMDVIVTDHHLPGEKLPDAYAVVDPKARRDETYPFKELCGTGLAWKLCCATLAVAPRLREKVPLGWEKWLLDMVGLATVADMVPLVGENRVLANYGLRVLRKSPRIGLAKLCDVARVNQRFITEDDIGFMLAPRVNAASRMGDAYDVLQLFTTRDESEADTIAKRLEKANRERRAAAGAITRAVHAKLKECELRSVIALGDPDWRPALLGLVANGISEEYGRPVFLWGREGNMNIKGSVRSGGVHALELMRAAGDTFAEFGGHAASGGFTVAPEAVFDLEDRLVAAFDRVMEERSVESGRVTRADALIGAEDVTLDLLRTLAQLAPFGMGNEKPVFCVRDAHIKRVVRFGKGSEHLKLTVAREEGELDAIIFFIKSAFAKRIEAASPGAHATLYAHLERDMFSKGMPVRLRLLDLTLV